MDETIHIKKQRGRPVGYRLDDSTKDKIRKKRLGTRHSNETKNKISKSLSEFFRSKESLADSISEEYVDFAEEITEWIEDNRDDINESCDLIMTTKRLSSMRSLEICLGFEIEQLFGHNANPEFFMLLKEELEKLGCKEELMELNSLI
jgi:hypothetical protein